MSEYYDHDTRNSDLYNASFLYNCELKKDKEHQEMDATVVQKDLVLRNLVASTYALATLSSDKEVLVIIPETM